MQGVSAVYKYIRRAYTRLQVYRLGCNQVYVVQACVHLISVCIRSDLSRMFPVHVHVGTRHFAYAPLHGCP